MPRRETPGNITQWPTWSLHCALLLRNRAFGISSVHYRQIQGTRLSHLLPCSPRLFQLHSSLRLWHWCLWTVTFQATTTLLSSPAGQATFLSVSTTVCEVWGTEIVFPSEVLPYPGFSWWQTAGRCCHTRCPSTRWSWKLWGRLWFRQLLLFSPMEHISPLSKTMRNRGTLIRLWLAPCFIQL